MQIRNKFFHLDETCPIFRYLMEGEVCFFGKACDALCKLADGTAEYKRMRDELDFRAFPDAWKKHERDILGKVIQVLTHLERAGDSTLNIKRIKQAYGFDAAKKISAQLG